MAQPNFDSSPIKITYYTTFSDGSGEVDTFNTSGQDLGGINLLFTSANC